MGGGCGLTAVTARPIRASKYPPLGLPPIVHPACTSAANRAAPAPDARGLSSRGRSAVTTALESVAFRILDDHVNHCVTGALASGDPAVAEEKSRELLDAVHRFSRSR